MPRCGASRRSAVASRRSPRSQLDPLLVGDELGPGGQVGELEGAVDHAGLREVVRADVQHHRLQLGRRVERQGPLRVAEVAGAERGEPAVEPLLLAQPDDGVLPVVLLVHDGAELTAGAEGAAHALQHHRVAALGVGHRHDEARTPAPRPYGERSSTVGCGPADAGR